MPQVVGKDGSVKSLDAFLIQPALTAGVILGQLPKVWPAGHLNKDAKPFLEPRSKILSRFSHVSYLWSGMAKNHSVWPTLHQKWLM